MDLQDVLEYIDDAQKPEVMELLDAVVNHFREVYDDTELAVLTLPVRDPEERRRRLKRTEELLRKWTAETGPEFSA